jgi:two-component system cell cycle sensor histidine kinase/response regulator CckA
MSLNRLSQPRGPVQFLEGCGYRVLPAGSPEHAMQSAEDYGGKIDLLLTDIELPRANGLELATRLCSSRPDMPVLYVSGLKPDDFKEGDDANHTFLRKPFDFVDLMKSIRELIDEHSGLSKL